LPPPLGARVVELGKAARNAQACGRQGHVDVKSSMNALTPSRPHVHALTLIAESENERISLPRAPRVYTSPV